MSERLRWIDTTAPNLPQLTGRCPECGLPLPEGEGVHSLCEHAHYRRTGRRPTNTTTTTTNERTTT